GARARLRDRQHRESVGARLGGVGVVQVADHGCEAAVADVQRLRAPLVTVADDGDRLSPERARIDVGVVNDPRLGRHGVLLVGECASKRHATSRPPRPPVDFEGRSMRERGMAADASPGKLPLNSEVDVVVVGAGFAGLYALYRLRALGFTTVVLERA